MKTIKQKEFDELVELHQLWLEDNSKGKRLEFADCIIKGIICINKNLSNAEFYNSKFNDSTFNYSKFNSATFNDSMFNYSKFNYSTFKLSVFKRSEFNDSEFYDSECYDSVFNNSELYNSIFYSSKFYNSKFYNSKFSYSKFYDSNFYNSNFYNCIGNGEEIVSTQFGTYNVVMLKDTITIGCEQHTVKEWLSFTDKELESMDGERGLDWWNRYSKIVFDLHKTHFGVEQ